MSWWTWVWEHLKLFFGKVKPMDKSETVTVPEPMWLTIAEGELEVSEIAGPGNNPRILEYHKSTTLKATQDAIPWCAAFVCWCLEQAGIMSPKSAHARDFERYGVAIESGKPGCIVVLSRGTNPNDGHVAFYKSETETHVQCLGGNQHDKVCVMDYPKIMVVDFRWPDKSLWKSNA